VGSKHKRKKRGGRSQGATQGGQGTAPRSGEAAVLDAQSTAGNAAVAASAGGEAPQLSQKEIRERIKAGQQRRAEEKQKEHDAKHGWFGSETWLGWGLDQLKWGGEDDSEGDPDYGEAEEAEDPKSIYDMLAPEVEITLAEKEFAGHIAGGNYSGKAELNTTLDGFKGSAEVEWVNGSSAEVSAPFTYSILGTTFAGSGTLSSFEGVKFKAKGEVDHEHAEIDLSAFEGTTVSAGTDVTLKIGDTELVAAKGSVGFARGTGGRFALKYSFAGGSIKLSTASTAAISGMGLTWDYEIELKTQSIVKGLWDYLPSWSTLWSYVSSATGVFGYSSTTTADADAKPPAGTPTGGGRKR
jgi:hypothetical protein